MLFYINFVISSMSRKFEAKDIEAINKLRIALKEGSSNSGNTLEEASTFDEGGLDEFHHDLLQGEKVTSVRIASHELISVNEDSKEFVSYEVEVATVDLSFRVNRRFSEFHSLYKRIRKSIKINCEFPKKIYNPFVSSTHESIIEERSNKLQIFLKEVLDFIRIGRDSFVAYSFFTFLAVKENYELKQLMPNYKKSNSEKLSYYRMLPVKPTLSEGLRSHYEECSLEFKLILLNKNISSEKCLGEIEEFVKSKRSKIGNDEIRMIFLGFEDCMGILKYGLTNCNESNRINALQLLLNFLSPERNPHFQRFDKIIEKVPISDWRVHEVHYLDNSIFKVLYFKLLSIFCEKVEKEIKTTEAALLKDLFLFHQNLYDDYFQWKKVAQHENYWKNETPRVSRNVDETLHLELTEFEDEPSNFVPLPFSQTSSRSVYLSHSMKTIALLFESNELFSEESLVNWNRYVSNTSVDSYTSIVRTSMTIHRKRINLRIKKLRPSQDSTGAQTFRNLERHLQEIQAARSILQDYDFRMLKEEYPTSFESEYYEQIWIKNQKGKSKILIGLHLASQFFSTQLEIQELAKCLYQDLISRFSS